MSRAVAAILLRVCVCVCACVCVGGGFKPEDVVTEQTILNSVLFKLFFILVFC